MQRYPSSEYFAGLFDGEGCIFVGNINGKDTLGTLRLSISNKDTRPLKILKELYGGCLSEDKRKTPSCYVWWVSALKAKRFIRNIFPFSIIKKEQLIVALKFPTGRRAQNLSNEGKKVIREEKLAVWRKLKSMHHEPMASSEGV